MTALEGWGETQSWESPSEWGGQVLVKQTGSVRLKVLVVTVHRNRAGDLSSILLPQTRAPFPLFLAWESHFLPTFLPLPRFLFAFLCCWTSFILDLSQEAVLSHTNVYNMCWKCSVTQALTHSGWCPLCGCGAVLGYSARGLLDSLVFQDILGLLSE